MISIITSLYRSDKHILAFSQKITEVSRILTLGKVDHEFIIISNDSSKAERSVLDSLINDPEINTRVIHCTRESLYASWNRGVRSAIGDIVTFWNVDDIRFADAITDGARMIVAGTDCIYFPFIYKRYVSLFGLKVLVKTRTIMPIEFDKERFKSEMHAGPFFMIRKTAIDKIGGFDESFTIAGDFEFMTRAASHISFEHSRVVAGIFTNDGTTLSGSKSSLHAQENFRITGSDIFTETFGLELMDRTHQYPDMLGNVRYYHRLKALRCIDFIKENSDKEKVFMDAGAGRGPYSIIASELYKKVYCYEYNKDELDAARLNVSAANVELESVDLTAIPLPDDSVDTIVCSEVLEHIPDNQKAVSEMYRILKKDGSLLVSMPNRFSLFYQKVYAKNRRSWFPKPPQGAQDSFFEERRHIEYPFWKIEKLVRMSDFRIVRRMGANIIPLPDKIRKKLILSYPRFFKAYVALERSLSSTLPWLSSFYFVELKK